MSPPKPTNSSANKSPGSPPQTPPRPSTSSPPSSWAAPSSNSAELASNEHEADRPQTLHRRHPRCEHRRKQSLGLQIGNSFDNRAAATPPQSQRLNAQQSTARPLLS